MSYMDHVGERALGEYQLVGKEDLLIEISGISGVWVLVPGRRLVRGAFPLSR